MISLWLLLQVYRDSIGNRFHIELNYMPGLMDSTAKRRKHPMSPWESSWLQLHPWPDILRSERTGPINLVYEAYGLKITQILSLIDVDWRRYWFINRCKWSSWPRHWRNHVSGCGNGFPCTGNLSINWPVKNWIFSVSWGYY